MSVETTVVAAIFGALSAVLVALFTSARQRRLATYRFIYKFRKDAVDRLWKMTDEFPVRPVNFDLNYGKLQLILDELKVWYFDHGAYVSPSTRDCFNRLQDAVISAKIQFGKGKIKGIALTASTPLHPIHYADAQSKCSILRDRLTDDLESRWSWENNFFRKYVFDRLEFHSPAVSGQQKTPSVMRKSCLKRIKEQMDQSYIWHDDVLEELES